jgi:hypothetical protein
VSKGEEEDVRFIVVKTYPTMIVLLENVCRYVGGHDTKTISCGMAHVWYGVSGKIKCLSCVVYSVQFRRL